jgi:hypothetical protein
MNIIDEGVKFLEDLILGDFNEQQMVSAQVVAGLISLIPGVDQVMDLRDVSGCLYRINKHGGLAKASLEQKVDLGFAAFGVVPSVGSAFKTVFKPLYKQRKATKGVVNGGVAMIERMLGQKKGGAVRWVRNLDWAGETQAAIIKANLALDSCIAMLAYIGQPHWWCPARVEQLARDVAPLLEAMRGKLAAPIREAANTIRKFLEEMLGEHAAAVAMTMATSVPLTRRTPQSARPGPALRAPGLPGHSTVGTASRIQARSTRSNVANTVQNLAFDLYKDLDFAAKGLMGEHIVEYHVIEKKHWGIAWNCHDMHGPAREGTQAGWHDDKLKKLNDNERPTYLCTPKTKVCGNGIDSLWRTNRAKPHEYAVVEAKSSMNPKAQPYQLLNEAETTPAGRTGSPASGRGQGRGRGAPAKPATPKVAKPKVMQMSRTWIEDRLRDDFPALRGRIVGNYSRHLFVVSPLQAGDHIKAMTEILTHGFINDPPRAHRFATMHDEHDVESEFGEADLLAAEKKYKEAGKFKRSMPPAKPGKGK